jgi:hypothetical protein
MSGDEYLTHKKNKKQLQAIHNFIE